MKSTMKLLTSMLCVAIFSEVALADCQTNRICGDSTVEDGYDYYANAGLGVKEANTKEECSCLCQQTDDCAAWTWVKADKKCWLKKDFTGKTGVTGMISGREECKGVTVTTDEKEGDTVTDVKVATFEGCRKCLGSCGLGIADCTYSCRMQKSSNVTITGVCKECRDDLCLPKGSCDIECPSGATLYQAGVTVTTDEKEGDTVTDVKVATFEGCRQCLGNCRHLQGGGTCEESCRMQKSSKVTITGVCKECRDDLCLPKGSCDIECPSGATLYQAVATFEGCRKCLGKCHYGLGRAGWSCVESCRMQKSSKVTITGVCKECRDDVCSPKGSCDIECPSGATLDRVYEILNNSNK